MRPDRVAGRHLRSRSELARADLVATHMLGRRGGWSGRLRRTPGHAWRHVVGASRKGLRFAGLDDDAWSVVGWKAEHLAAVCRLRLQLEARFPGPGGVRAGLSGPLTRQRRRVRIPDGILGQPAHCIGVEVELHRKAAHRYEAILADVDPVLSECW